LKAAVQKIGWYQFWLKFSFILFHMQKESPQIFVEELRGSSHYLHCYSENGVTQGFKQDFEFLNMFLFVFEKFVVAEPRTFCTGPSDFCYAIPMHFSKF
jgi:hypothetical protein